MVRRAASSGESCCNRCIEMSCLQLNCELCVYIAAGKDYVHLPKEFPPHIVMVCDDAIFEPSLWSLKLQILFFEGTHSFRFGRLCVVSCSRTVPGVLLRRRQSEHNSARCYFPLEQSGICQCTNLQTRSKSNHLLCRKFGSSNAAEKLESSSAVLFLRCG